MSRTFLCKYILPLIGSPCFWWAVLGGHSTSLLGRTVRPDSARPQPSLVVTLGAHCHLCPQWQLAGSYWLATCTNQFVCLLHVPEKGLQKNCLNIFGKESQLSLYGFSRLLVCWPFTRYINTAPRYMTCRHNATSSTFTHSLTLCVAALSLSSSSCTKASFFPL